MMTFGVTRQGDMTGLNVHILSTNSRYIKQKQPKVKIGKSTSIVGDFFDKALLFETETMMGQKKTKQGQYGSR